MYAVVRTGGKQYRVAPGDILEVEKLTGEVGESIVLDDVLMVSSDEGVKIGQPRVEGASVTARITGQHRGEKILVFRYRPKKRVRVRRGHRQYLTRLQIHKISGEDFEFVEEAEEAVVEAVAAVEDGVEAEDGTETAEPESAEDDEADAAFAMLKETVAKTGVVVDETVSVAGEVVEETVSKAGDVVDDTIAKAGDDDDDGTDENAAAAKASAGDGQAKDNEADSDEKKEE